MFDRRLLWTGVAIAVTIAASLFLADLPGGGVIPSQETVSDIEKTSPPGDVTAKPGGSEEYAYILKNHNGHIAVFIPGKDEPEIVFETLVRFLPDYDRVQMEAGIPVKDEAALAAIVEDFIS